MRRVLPFILAATLGCSSVPDVSFDDGGASAVTITDAGRDTIAPVDASKPVDAGPTYSCATPGHAPPASVGICCGMRLCLKCNVFQCDRCDKENCSPTEVCCAKNALTTGNSIACQAATATCN